MKWGESLEVGFREHGQLERLREGLRSGRPLGDDAFSDDLEAKLGRPLRLQKTGHPPKEKPDGMREKSRAESEDAEGEKSTVANVSATWDDQRSDRNSETR